jgi:hypothetical protein
MKIPQGNSLCNYFKQPKISSLSSSYTKSENRRVENVLSGVGGGGVGTRGRESR